MLVLEIALGIVLGVLLLRTLPALLGVAIVAALILLGALALAALIAAGVLAVLHWDAVLTVAGALAFWVLGAAVAHAIETRSRYTVDELFIVCVAIIAMPLLAMLSAWLLYVSIRDSLWQGLAVAAVAAVLIIAAGLVARVFVRRAARRPPGWNAPLPLGAKVIESD